MTDYLQVVVRFLHIFFGIAWVGGIMFMGHAVGAGLKNAPPHVRGPAMLMIGGKATTFFTVVAPLTVLFGIWNQYLVAGEVSYQGGPWNVTMGAALVLSLIMGVVAFGIVVPTFRKMKAMAPPPGSPPPPPGAQPPPQLVALQKRMMMASMGNLALGLIVVGLMVWAVILRTAPA